MQPKTNDKSYSRIIQTAQPTSNIIRVNARGVRFPDGRGKATYRGIEQSGVGMAVKFFGDAQKFWASQQINGAPLVLTNVMIKTAANNVLPYNAVNPRGITPIEGTNLTNRIAWYSTKFTVAGRAYQTPWMCNRVYPSVYGASKSVVVDVLRDIAGTKMVHVGILAALERLVR